jgi:hypothetical protein
LQSGFEFENYEDGEDEEEFDGYKVTQPEDEMDFINR